MGRSFGPIVRDSAQPCPCVKPSSANYTSHPATTASASLTHADRSSIPPNSGTRAVQSDNTRHAAQGTTSTTEVAATKGPSPSHRPLHRDSDRRARNGRRDLLHQGDGRARVLARTRLARACWRVVSLNPDTQGADDLELDEVKTRCRESVERPARGRDGSARQAGLEDVHRG